MDFDNRIGKMLYIRVGFIAGFSILAFLISTQHIKQKTVFLSSNLNPQYIYIYSKTGIKTENNTSSTLSQKNTSKPELGYDVITGSGLPEFKSDKKVEVNNSHSLNLVFHNINSDGTLFSPTVYSEYKTDILKFSDKTVSGNHVTNSLQDSICKEKKTNVAFLKVHKAGSTTIMNIFLRYAVGNDLNIVLPKRWQGSGFNYLGYGKTLSRKNIVPLPPVETYNILCNHVIYNRAAFADVMPPDSVYIGIIRDPTSHFVSASVYYGFYESVKKIMLKRNELNLNESFPKNETVLSEFLKNPDNFRNVSTAFVRNRMSYDFGIHPKLFNNEIFIDYYLKKLDEDFKLVMIMEYFHESLVLMKRLLCWDLKDILYVPLNINSRKRHLSLSTDDLQRLRRWNYADYRLYNHFNRTFWKRVEKEGMLFHEEVKHFKEIQKNVTQFCKNVDENRYLFVEESQWNNHFTVVQEDCAFMTLKELPLMKHLVISAWSKYYSWLGNQAFDKTSSQTTTTANNINLANIPFVIQ